MGNWRKVKNLFESGANALTDTFTGAALTTLRTVTIPAGTLSVGSVIRVDHLWHIDLGASSPNCRVYVGIEGAQAYKFGTTTQTSARGCSFFGISEAGFLTGLGGNDDEGYGGQAALIRIAVDISADIDITFYCNNDQTDDKVSLMAYVVEVF